MKKLLMVLSLILMTGPALAANKECGFAPRKVMSELLSNLDPAIIGLADCHEALPDTSSLVVGQFKILNETKLREFVLSHAKVADGTAHTATVTWQSRQLLDQRQMIVKTQSPPNPSRQNKDVMSHYAFVAKAKDGSFLVFVHSAMEADAKKLRPALEKLNRQLRQQTFLALL